jgi:NAD(P)-dependent dehydrogenase (short-subunit alcohol dehydrogenase family)
MQALLVTGGSRGIGAAVAALGAARGYAVALGYREARGAAEDVVATIRAAGGRAVALALDVADEASVASFFEAAADAFGPPAALVNNAGITGPMTRLADLAAVDLHRVLAVNVAGAVLCAREAVRRMSLSGGGRGGAIVNVSSRAAQLGGAGEWIHYALSKGALDTLTIGLARETASDGIRVNAVAPGLIETGLHAAAGDPGRLARLAPAIPQQRAGLPDEVARAVLWLLSAEAAYVNGAILPVSGGR